MSVRTSDAVTAAVAYLLNQQKLLGYTREPVRAGIEAGAISAASKVLAENTEFRLMASSPYVSERHMFAMALAVVARYMRDSGASLNSAANDAVMQFFLQIAGEQASPMLGVADNVLV